MTKEQFVLAVMAPSVGDPFSSVQIQKIVFVAEKRLPELLDKGEEFNFQAYHYGPFDAQVYRILESLKSRNMALIGSVSFRLTVRGHMGAAKIFETLDPRHQGFLKELYEFVRDCSFSDLIASVYKEWPEMRSQSVMKIATPIPSEEPTKQELPTWEWEHDSAP